MPAGEPVSGMSVVVRRRRGAGERSRGTGLLVEEIEGHRRLDQTAADRGCGLEILRVVRNGCSSRWRYRGLCLERHRVRVAVEYLHADARGVAGAGRGHYAGMAVWGRGVHGDLAHRRTRWARELYLERRLAGGRADARERTHGRGGEDDVDRVGDKGAARRSERHGVAQLEALRVQRVSR